MISQIRESAVEKINEKQCVYLLILELFGIITLLLPGLLSRNLSQDAPVGLVIGFLMAAVFTCILYGFNKNYGNQFLTAKKKSNFLIESVSFMFFIQTLLLTALGLNMTGEIVQIFLLPELNKFLIILPFLGLCIYALSKNIASRARMALFFGRIFIFLFIFILFSSVGRIDMNQYEAIFIAPAKDILLGGYEVFIILESVIFSLFAVTVSNKKEHYKKTVKIGLIVNFVIAMFILIVLIGVFGVDYMGAVDYPAISVLKNLLNSGFISRLDVSLIGIWIVSLFYFVCGGMNYCHMLLQSVLEENSGRYLNYVVYAVIFGIAWLFGNVKNSYYIYRFYMFYIGTPLTIVILLVLILLAKGRTKKVSGEQNE